MPITATPPANGVTKTITMDTTSSNFGRAVGTASSDINNPPPAVEPTTQEVMAKELLGTTPEGTPEPVAPVAPDQDARQLFIKAQKAERRASAQMVKAKEMAAKAEKYEIAMASANPIDKYTALGLDPQKEYEAMTKHLLSNMGDEKVDPVEERFKAQEAQLKLVTDQLAKEQAERVQLATNNSEVQALQTHVIPIITKDPDRYETLIMQNGDDPMKAAIFVYNTAKEIYFKTGQSPDFTELADGLEKYQSDLIEAGINKAYKMKKFKNRMALSQTSTDQTQDVIDQTIRTSQPPTTQVPIRAPILNDSMYIPSLDGTERRAQFKKKHGIQ